MEWAARSRSSANPDKPSCLAHCPHRPLQMCQFLIGEGFSDVKNVTGGIDAYSRGVDSNVPKY